MNDKILLGSPAKIWEEGFPIGNGKIGAMVLGNYDKERIALNTDELWSGYGKEKVQKNSSGILEEIRKSIQNGKYDTVEEKMKNNFLNEWNESFLPLGDLYFQYLDTEKPVGYKRILDLEHGIAKCEFQRGEKRICTKAFCPVNPRVFVVKISSDKKQNVKIWLDSILRHNIKALGNTIFLWGTAPSNVQPNYYECENPVTYSEKNKGMGFCAGLYVVSDGILVEENGEILVKDSREIICYITAETGFDAETGRISKSVQEVKEECRKNISEAVNWSFIDIYKEHKQEFSSIYNRMNISLTDYEEQRYTDDRLKVFGKESDDLGMVELFFHYGRYLLISCSREGTMAANLQGMWNDKMRAPWSSNYTTNINLQMNYWMAEKANLPEMHMPLFELLRHCVENGRKVAKEQFGCRGWVANHNIDCWYQTSPVGMQTPKNPVKYGYFPIASGWLCLHIWEHYLYTQDEGFLEKYYFVFREACVFYEDYLKEIDGKYVTIPSTSPENLYRDSKGRECALSIGTTIDISIIRMLFKAFLKTAKILKKDEEMCGRLKKIVSVLPDYQIGGKGTLMEWSQDYEEVYPEHRHLSHMVGLYPGREILEKPYLWSACEKTLECRTMEGPAWSKVWKSCLWARLGEGEKAYEQLCRLLEYMYSTEIQYSESGCFCNLLCTPPFQIDGNLGIPAAIMEMLVLDTEKKVKLLPAIPQKWKNGSVTGMKIMGGHELNFSWKEKIITEITIKWGKEKEILLECNNKTMVLKKNKCGITNIMME